MSDTTVEQKTETKTEVSYRILDFRLSFLYSAQYFTIPEFTEPLAKLSTTAIKLVRDPTKATPAGPANVEITFVARNPEVIFTKVVIPEKIVVLSNFIFFRIFSLVSELFLMFLPKFSDHFLMTDFGNIQDLSLLYLEK